MQIIDVKFLYGLYMNRIRPVFILLFTAVALLASSCVKDAETPEVEYLEVTAHNISGQWQLVEWNGAALLEGTYMYMDIVRDERTYTIYQNVDSFENVPHVVTGSYYIETDPQSGAVIRGNYDHGMGDWAHRYIVKSLTASEMIWMAKDDGTFIQKFRRVDEIPGVLMLYE